MSKEIDNSLTSRDVFGFPFTVGNIEGAVAYLAGMANTLEQPYTVAAADVHVLTRGVQDAAYAACLHSMDMIVPDGMPIVWLMNKSGGVEVAERISGPDLMLGLMRKGCGGPPLRHFLLGGSTELLEELVKQLQESEPAVQIVSTYSPPFGEWNANENEKISTMIRDSGSNMVWVGLGCPKQEMWMYEQKHILPPAVYFGVGAAFAFHSGAVQRAPLWMQRNGLEWLYRIYKEPRRLFARYVKHNTLFLYYLITKRRKGAI